MDNESWIKVGNWNTDYFVLCMIFYSTFLYLIADDIIEQIDNILNVFYHINIHKYCSCDICQNIWYVPCPKVTLFLIVLYIPDLDIR